MMYYSVMSSVSFVISLAVIGLAVWALVAAALRSSGDFAFAGTTKRFWIIALVASLLVSLNGVMYYVPMYFGWLISIAAIVAPIYFLGLVRSRMPRSPKRPPTQRGGW